MNKHSHTIVACFLAFILAVFSAPVFAGVAEGLDYTYQENSSNCTVNIYTANGLQNIGLIPMTYCVNPEYKLANDLEMFDEPQESTCIVNWDNTNATFTGTLDGNGYTVSGICFKTSESDYAHLFDIGNGATITNLHFDNIYVGNTNTSSNTKYVSFFKPALVTSTTTINVTDVVIENSTIGVTSTGSRIETGFILSRPYNNIYIDNVSVENSSMAISSKRPYVGGLIGYINSSSTASVKNSKFQGQITNISATDYSQTGGLIGYVISDVPTFIAENNAVDADIRGEGTATTYVGGLIATIDGGNATLKDNVISGSLYVKSNTTSGSYYASVGGLVAQFDAELASFSSTNDSVKASIESYGYAAFAGGFIGRIEYKAIETVTLTSSVFVGNISATGTSTSSTYPTYVGGAIGYAYYTATSATSVLNLNDVQIGTPDDYTSILVMLNNSSGYRYVGGLIGRNYVTTTINKGSVWGKLSLYSTSGYPYVSGLVGYSDSYNPLKISNSSFVGSLPNAYIRYGLAYANNSSSTIENSYAIDLSASASQAFNYSYITKVGFGTSLTNAATVKTTTTTVGSAKVQTPSFARLLTDFYYDLNTNNGFPTYTGPDGFHNKQVFWREIVDNATPDTLYEAYTDGENHIAFTPSGSAVASTDLPQKSYPAGFSETGEDRISISTQTGWPNDLSLTITEDPAVYTLLRNSSTPFEGEDYEISGCTILIKTKYGLENVSSIPLGSCTDAPSYKLANDIVVSEAEQGSSCKTNWNSDKAVIKGTFDGDGHTISGICINKDSTYAYILNIQEATQVSNVNFKNIAIAIQRGTVYSGAPTAYVSIFRGSSTSNLSNVNVDKIYLNGSLGYGSNSSTNPGGYIAVFFARIGGSIDHSRVTNAEIKSSSGSFSYIGGFVGYNSYSSITDSYFSGTIHSYSNNGAYLGGLIANQYNGSTFYRDTVEATIDANGYTSHVGGFIGTAYTFQQTIEISSSIFKGKLSGGSRYGDDDDLTSIAGFVGYGGDIILDNVAAMSVNGRTDTLVYAIGTPSYVAGLVGYKGSGSGSATIKNSFALGSVGNITYGGERIAAGLACEAKLVENSYFLGNLPDKEVTYSYGLAGTAYNGSAKNSYAFDLNGMATKAYSYNVSENVGFGTSMESTSLVYTNGDVVGKAYPQTPVYAHMLKTFTYDPNVNEGFPWIASETAKPTHMLLGINDGDTLFYVFTDTTEKIAFKKDGSAFTATDLQAIEYPEDWPEDKKIDLATVYNEDLIYKNLLSSSDYEISNCEVLIKTAKALQRIGVIDVGSCENVTYKLANDIAFGSSVVSSCETNWNSDYSNFTGTLDGQGFTISGICLNTTDVENVYLFDVSKGATIKNLNFENAYIGATHVSNPYDFNVSIFKSSQQESARINLKDLSFSNIIVNGSFTDAISYEGLLFAKVRNGLFFDNVTATNISLNSTSATYSYVGGLIAYHDNMNDTLSIANTSFTGNISSDALNIGGFAGYIQGNSSVATPVVNIEKSSFTGKISPINSAFWSRQTLHAGGFIGSTGYRFASFKIKNVTVKSSAGYNGLLIEMSGDQLSSTWSYFAGLIARSDALNLDIDSVKVLGSIDIPETNKNTYVAGLIASTYYTAYSIANSYYIGSFPVSDVAQEYGLLYDGSQKATIANSYAIDLNGSAKAAWNYNTNSTNVGFGLLNTDSVEIFTNGEIIGKAKVHSPEFARLLGNYTYDPNENDGFPILASSTDEPTHRILGIFKNDTIYDFYTNAAGNIAYNAEGDAVSSSDLPTSYPTGWPVENQIDLTTKYTEDVFNIVALSDEDYEINGCEVTLKTESSLMKVAYIPVSECQSTITFKLDKDMDFGGTYNEECVSNWDNTLANIKGVLDGDGHTVSNICLNATDLGHAYLFDVSEANATIQNISFENIYIADKRSANSLPYYVSMFNANGTTGFATTFANVQLNNITILNNASTYIGYTALLLARTENAASFENVNATNISIKTKNEKYSFTGAFVGVAKGPSFSVEGCSIGGSVSGSSKTEQNAYVGGIIAIDSTQNSFSIQNTKVRAALTDTAYVAYTGGIASAIYYTGSSTKLVEIKNSSFVGTIKDSTYTTGYMGGLIGYSNATSITMDQDTVSAREGYDDELIAFNSSFSGRSYIGGFIAYNYDSAKITKGLVLGTFNSAVNADYVGGFIAYNYYSGSSISNSYFVGSLIKSTNTFGLGSVRQYQSATISNSYAIDLAARATSPWSDMRNTTVVGFGNSKTKDAWVRSNSTGHGQALPQTPVFANTLQNFAFDPSVNDGFPFIPSEGQKPTYHVLGVYGNDTLYNVYTNPTGRIAYYEDGSVVTQDDIEAIEYPGDWPNEKKIDLTTSYSENTVNTVLVLASDYELDGCTIHLKHERALQNISYIPFGGCASPVYKLDRDMDFGAENSHDCKTNWNTDNVLINGTLDGNDYTISGICVNVEDSTSVYLFDIVNGAKINNVKFKDIYLSNKIIYGTNQSYVSLFRSNYTQSSIGNIEFSDIEIDNVSVIDSAGGNNAYAALLLSRNYNSIVTINNVVAMNDSVYGQSNYTNVGGFIACDFSESLTITNSSIKASNIIQRNRSSSTTLNSYVGGLVGYSEALSTTATITIQKDTVEAMIDGQSSSVGGFIGYTYGQRSKLSVSDSKFKGIVRGSSSYGIIYTGGVVGCIYNAITNFIISNSLVTSSKESVADTVIYAHAKNHRYVGGVVGYTASKSNIDNVSVLGSIYQRLSTYTTSAYSYVTGLIGYASSSTTNSATVKNSRFIGKLFYESSGSSYKFVYGLGGRGLNTSSNSVANSYAIDLNGKADSAWVSSTPLNIVGMGNSLTDSAWIMTGADTVAKAKPQTPVFARALGNYLYESDVDEGFPKYVGPIGDRNYRILWITKGSTNDTLIEAYTNSSGKIAYLADGSAITAADLPETARKPGETVEINEFRSYYYPNGWPNSLETVYTKDTVFVEEILRGYKIVENVDYSYDGCTVLIHTNHALEDIARIPTGGCKNVTYKLTNDLDYGTENKDCSEENTNWDNTNSMFTGTLDGDGHTISNVCMINADSANTFLLRTNGESSIKNLNFNNIYLKSTYGTGDVWTSIFNYYNKTTLSSETMTVSFSNMKLENVDIISNTPGAYTALLLAKNNDQNTLIENVDAKNIEINATTPLGYILSSNRYVGGLLAYGRHSTILNAKFKGNINSENINTVGGFIGFVENNTLSSDTIRVANSSFEGNINSTTVTHLGGLIALIENSSTNIVFSEDTVRAHIIHNSVSSGEDLHIGGVVGRSTPNVAFNNIHFIGDIKHNATYSRTPYIGGILGSGVNAAKFNDVHVQSSNKKSTENLISVTEYYTVYVGGICGIISGHSSYESYIKNSNVIGSIDIYSSSAYVGGFVGYHYTGSDIESSTFEGKIFADLTSYRYVGGLFGYTNTYTSNKPNQLHFKDVSVKGVNEGGKNTLLKITNSRSTSGDIYAGGLIGYAHVLNYMENTSVEGSVIFDDKLTTYTTYIGGMFGYIYDYNATSMEFKESSYKGTISVDNSNGSGYGSDSYVGGFAGYMYTTTNVVLDGITVESESGLASDSIISFNRNLGSIYAGGLSGYYYNAYSYRTLTIKNIDVKGIVGVESSASPRYYMGGLFGKIYQYSGDYTKFENIDFTGLVTLNSTASLNNMPYTHIGGVAGMDSIASTMDLSIKNVNITSPTKSSTDDVIRVKHTATMAPMYLYAGGVFGYFNGASAFDGENVFIKGKFNLENANTFTQVLYGGTFIGYVYNSAPGEFRNSYYIGSVDTTGAINGPPITAYYGANTISFKNTYVANTGSRYDVKYYSFNLLNTFGYTNVNHENDSILVYTYNNRTGLDSLSFLTSSPAFAHALGTFTYKSGANENYPYIPSATELTTKEILYVTIVDDVADTLYRFYTNELGKAAYLPDGSPITKNDLPVIEKEYGENEFSEGETEVFYLNGWKKLSLSDTYTEDVVYSMAPADLYRGHIQIVIPEDCGKIFQVGEHPETYTYGQEVAFANLGSTEAKFLGWELSKDGVVFATLNVNDALAWTPDVFGEIEATALFDKTVTIDLERIIESSDTNSVLYVMYNGDTLDVEDGKVTVPYVSGLELQYAIVAKDTANKAIASVVVDGQKIDAVGTILVEQDVVFDISTKNVYHITFNDGENSVVIRVDEDEKIESGITIPAENFTYNQEKDKVTFWTGVVNETLKLWDNDTATVYNQSVSFEKQEFVADSIIGFVLPEEYIWNGSATGVFLNSNLPTIVYEDHGFYKIASSWIIAIADKSDSATINSRDEALEFMKRHYDIVADGFTFALNEKAAEDNSFKVEVNDVENIAIAGAVLDKPVEYDLLNNANTVIPRLNAPRFIGRPDEVLQITQYNDAGDSVAVLHITSGEVLTLADNVARISVKMLNHLDTYGIQNAEIALSGSAMLLNIETVDFDAQNPVELAVRLYAGDSLIVDSVITDNAEAKSYSYMRYPLLPGTYRAVVTLEGAGKPVEYKTDAFEVGSVARTIEPGSWSIVSLASTGDNFNMQNENDAAIYYWDETAPLGEFMQYNRLDHSDSIDPVAGYWYYTKTATDLTVSSIDLEDSIAWNLHNKFSGWNLVANPYAWRILVSESDFKNPEDTSTVFWQWNAATSSYKPADTLDIYEGMWIYSDVDTMFAVSSKPVFDMPKHPGAATKYATKKTSIDSWSLRLSLVGETGVEDSWNVVGVGSQEINVLEPPSGMGDNVSLAVENGRKALAKSIKTSTRDASWNIAYKASENQTGKLYVEGLEELEELGYGATLTIDGETIVLSSETPATLKLTAFAKQAKLEVKKISEMQKIASISNLRYHVESNKMHVKFNLPTSAAGTMVNARVLDIHGKVVSYNRETGFGGENTIVLDVPKNSGIYFLNVKAGSNSKNVTIKF